MVAELKMDHDQLKVIVSVVDGKAVVETKMPILLDGKEVGVYQAEVPEENPNLVIQVSALLRQVSDQMMNKALIRAADKVFGEWEPPK